MIQINDTVTKALIPYGIAPRRRACCPNKAQQTTRGVTS
jgi:hypothetical protein